MTNFRTNEDWLRELSTNGPEQSKAVEDLRNTLLQAALFTFTRIPENETERSQGWSLYLAEECAQEALMAVLAHLPEFRGDSKFTTWAYKFAVNIALATARRERWKGISLEHLDEPFSERLISEFTDPDPQESILQSEVSKIIDEIIQNELTPRQRQVLKWIVFDEVPMDVVVQRLDTNRNAVYKVLHDARLKIKAQLLARGFDPGETVDLFGSQK